MRKRKEDMMPEEKVRSSGYNHGESEIFQKVLYFDIQAARGLCYSDAIIEELKQATTTTELTKIMIKGRKQKFG